MNKNKQLQYINIFIFMMLIFAIAIFNLLTPKNKTISESENRTLAKMPSLSLESFKSGQFSRDFENFFSDHFLNREVLVRASKELSSLKGIKREEEVFLVDFEGQNVGGNKSGDSKDEDSTQEQASTNGNLLILNDTVMELYKFNEESSRSYAQMINTLDRKLNKDVKVYSLIAPIQIEFLNNKKYRDLSDSQKDAIDFIKSNFSDDIIPVDAYTSLKEHIDEYIYFRTDHHWTALGAYYGYRSFAMAAGFDPLSLDDFKKGEVPGFLGQISTVNKSEKVNNNPDNVIYYNPPVKSTMRIYYYDKDTGEKKSYEGSIINKSFMNTDQKYGIFIGGDYPLGVIKTNANTGKKIMVIKDSYGNSFTPFLVSHYSEIYVVDPRHYKESLVDLVEENNIDEVIFVNYILTTSYGSYAESVLNLLD